MVSTRALAFLLALAALLAPHAAALGLDLRVDAGPVAASASIEGSTPAPAGAPTRTSALAPALAVIDPLRALAPTSSLPAPLAPAAATALASTPPRPLDLDAAPAREASVAAESPPPAVAAGGMMLLYVALERLGLGRVLALLYSRLAPSRLLEHERREHVVRLVGERPGIGPQEIGEALGTSWGVTSYHLEKLERGGLVTSQRMGHHRCYFLPGAVPREAQKQVGMFRADTTRRVAKLVSEQPGIAQSQLCQTLGLSASAASKQLSRLEAASLVRREPEAGTLRLYPGVALAGAV